MLRKACPVAMASNSNETVRMRPQLSKGSTDKALEMAVNVKNKRMGSASGCAFSFIFLVHNAMTQRTAAARKALTAPLLEIGAHSATAARQTKIAFCRYLPQAEEGEEPLHLSS